MSTRLTRTPALLIVLALAALPAVGQSGTGEADPSGRTADTDGSRDSTAYPVLTYLDGPVEAVRYNRSLRPDALFGAPVEPFDYLETESDGVARMRLGEDDAGVTVVLDPDSAVMVHPAPVTDGVAGRLTLELLRGSIVIDAGPARATRVLFREGEVDAVGARFAVARGALGSIRVEAASGRPVVRIDGARPPRLFGGPERWVLYSADGELFENTEPAGSVGQWRTARLTLAAMDETVRAERASTYLEAKEVFDSAYADLIEAEPGLLAWMRDSDTRRRLSDEVAAGIETRLARLEAARRAFEPLFLELSSLAPILGPDTLPASVPEDGRIITERLHTARHVLRLFHESQGRLPEVAGPEDDTGTEDDTGIPATGM